MIDTLALASLLLLCAYILHKVRRVHLFVHEQRDAQRLQGDNHFRQLEALHGLYASLGLRYALPETRGWAASPDFLRELMMHALLERPACVVECSSGLSTLVLARCMQINGAGKVYSLEHDAAYARRTRRLLALHGLQDWAEVIDAPLRRHQLGGRERLWYDHSGLHPGLSVDMLVIDGPPQDVCDQARYAAGPLLFPRLAPGGCVFLDDAARPDEQAALLRWREEFPEFEFGSLPCEKGAALLRYLPRM